MINSYDYTDAAALLDDNEKMIGSVIVADFETREASDRGSSDIRCSVHWRISE